MKKLLLIKLSTGEELIGEFVWERGETVTLNNIAQILTTEITEKGCQYGMIPYAPYREDSSIDFNSKHIVYKVNPSSDFASSYTKMFSPIHVEENKIITDLK